MHLYIAIAERRFVLDGKFCHVGSYLVIEQSDLWFQRILGRYDEPYFIELLFLDTIAGHGDMPVKYGIERP